MTADGLLSWGRMILLAGVALLLFLPGLASLPVTDRDEARFAQASRQMVQSGDLVTPRFQDEPRYKKPIGIYWLQAAAVHLSGQGPDAAIWVYRLPSLLGAVAATLLIALAGAPLVGRDLAGLAALLFAVGLVIGGEARLAKTDAVLLCTILLAQGALARLWLGLAGRGWVFLFWLATALAVLVKGPIGPLLFALTIAALVLWERRVDWLRPLWSARPILLAALVAGPWFLAILLQSNGAFWSASVGEDLLAKAMAGQEGKGAPPGTHLIFTLFGFWPAVPLLLLALPSLWASRTTRETRFLIAWALPFWAVYEAVPTKLLHYLLPVYPALALMAVRQFARPPLPTPTWLRVIAACAVLPGLALGLALAIVAARGGAGTIVVAGLAITLGVATVLLLYGLWQEGARSNRRALVLSLLCAGGLLHGAMFLSLGRIPQLWPTESAAGLLQDMARRQGCATVDLVSFGYHEPSLVFRAGAETRLFPADAPVHGNIQPGPCVAVLQALSADEALPPLPVGCGALGTVSGFAIGAGRWVVLNLLECRGDS